VLDFSQDYFALFGLPVGFPVDRERLAESYRALQGVVHPDRFANASDQERRLSMQASTRVNEAFQTLKDPLRRARYLLVLHAGDPGPDHESTCDAAFLMDQMDLREALAGARGRPDPQAVIGEVLDQLQREDRALHTELTDLFADPTPDRLVAAREAVRKLQFLDKCRREAEALEIDLEQSDL
jgi:molecular chaperone HscB